MSCTSTVRVNFPSCTSPRSFFFQTSLTYTEVDPCFNLEIQICSFCLSRAGLGKIVAYLYPNGKIVSKRPSLPLLTLAGAAPCFQPIASRQIETAAGASPVQNRSQINLNSSIVSSHVCSPAPVLANDQFSYQSREQKSCKRNRQAVFRT